ncbi:MAG: Lrp/AsnC family transcriptional regulator [Rhodospirillaceae bacterium]|jgi:siroheme decarboxylase|nr:Lrp/AsnC family transcriptional regulator [Rhodospirillaceae bacterium]MBT5243478.1 Lrp/AsnC family transcriptional regulator [Rhodospirillaceae bacterium]MBT5562066.1 Lrp/AsnC family transcriptional regulator [Rhodospirillaceae bacterium]MBT6242239.1 Lrp/AsnC family transcriptional regulator [Rhodospirillaceae bacterium]MBT7136271.1 Lrp/AsnC family transcriptional regulator [Rhodospirillaceae bacterium]
MSAQLDAIDRALINDYQGGFPLSAEPFAEVGASLGIDAEEALARVTRLLEDGTLSRFGPMYHAEKMGGGLTLAALEVPEDDYERIAEIVNGFDEVAHNYARDHDFNMWFVLATETPEGVAETISKIEAATGLVVHNMPKKEEFFIGLRFEA